MSTPDRPTPSVLPSLGPWHVIDTDRETFQVEADVLDPTTDRRGVTVRAHVAAEIFQTPTLVARNVAVNLARMLNGAPPMGQETLTPAQAETAKLACVELIWALRLLERLRIEGTSIIDASKCTALEIASARDDGRLFAAQDGNRYLVRQREEHTEQPSPKDSPEQREPATPEKCGTGRAPDQRPGADDEGETTGPSPDREAGVDQPSSPTSRYLPLADREPRSLPPSGSRTSDAPPRSRCPTCGKDGRAAGTTTTGNPTYTCDAGHGAWSEPARWQRLVPGWRPSEASMTEYERPIANAPTGDDPYREPLPANGFPKKDSDGQT